MKRMTMLTFAVGCLLVCATQTWTQQQQSQASRLRQKRIGSSYRTVPSEEVLAQQLKSLEARLTQLQAKARELEISSQRTTATLEKKVARLNIKPTLRQPIPPEAGGDIAGFTKQGDKYIFAAHGAKIEIDAAGNLLFQAAGQLTLESAAILHAKASVIKLGNKPERPVAALQDVIAGNSIVETSCKNVLVE